MEKIIIRSPNAPAAIGPYSQGVKSGSLVFLSGQIPINPATGSPVTGDIKVKTRQVLNNLKAVVEAVGGSLENMVKITIFLTNMDDFAAVNEVYGEFFPKTPPARSCVAVSCLPKECEIEIEGIAVM